MKKILLAVLLLGALGAGGAFLWVQKSVGEPAGPPASPDVEVTIPKGATARSLGPLLLQQGLIKDTNLWRYFLWRRGVLNAKAGRHLVSARMPMAELATALEGVPIPEDVPFVVIEGWRLRDIDKALAEKGWCKPGEFIKAASDPAKFKAVFPLPPTTLEGYLYPETYQVPVAGVDLHTLIQRQLDTFGERFFTPNKTEIQTSGRTLDQLVVMCAIARSRASRCRSSQPA